MPLLTRNFAQFRLLIEYTYSPGTPDQTYGPPENCYEGDAEELDIESIALVTPAASINLTAIGFMPELCEGMNETIEGWCMADWEARAESAMIDRAEARWEAARD